MSEPSLRKVHRKLGITLLLFLILQTVSGLYLTVQALDWDEHYHDTLGGSPLPSHSHQERGDRMMHRSSMSFTQAGADLMVQIHHGGGLIGAFYRIALAALVTAQVATGLLIYWNVRKRTRKRGRASA